MIFNAEQLQTFLQEVMDNGGEKEIIMDQYPKGAVREARLYELIDFHGKVERGSKIIVSISPKGVEYLQSDGGIV